MVAMAVEQRRQFRSVENVPPDRWKVPVAPEPARLGHAIRALRKAKKLNQEQLGKKLGLDGSTISGWESGRSEPSEEDIRKVAKELGGDAAKLFAMQDEHRKWRREQEPLPGPSYAIPREIELIRAVDVLFKYETEDLVQATDWLESNLKRPDSQKGERATG